VTTSTAEIDVDLRRLRLSTITTSVAAIGQITAHGPSRESHRHENVELQSDSC